MKLGLRAFLALDIAEEQLVTGIKHAQQEILATGADVKVVEPENLHFTLKFFGEIPETMGEQIYTRLADLTWSPVRVQFEDLGCFPSVSRISVIWAGADPEASKILKNLASEVERRLKMFGFHNERDFSPHLTIARVKSGLNREKLQELINVYQGHVFGSDVLTSLKIKKSQLTPQGPIYSDVYEVQFRGES